MNSANQHLKRKETGWDAFVSPILNPEQQASKSEMRGLLERSIDALPDSDRAVVIMRDVEEMSTI